MKERTNVVTSRGRPVTLLGDEIQIGRKAPEFTALANDLSTAKLSTFAGKVLVIASVPSLDTPVCDIETRRFNVEAQKLSEDVKILVLSMDLPFAQARWCGQAGVSAVQTLSDHRDASFGQAYGVLIKESRLLARAVFVIDREGIVRYVQLVKDMSQEPDYEQALAAVKNLL